MAPMIMPLALHKQSFFTHNTNQINQNFCSLSHDYYETSTASISRSNDIYVSAQRSLGAYIDILDAQSTIYTLKWSQRNATANCSFLHSQSSVHSHFVTPGTTPPNYFFKHYASERRESKAQPIYDHDSKSGSVML